MCVERCIVDSTVILVCCFPPVTMAKGIANGFPMGAVVTTPGIYSVSFSMCAHVCTRVCECVCHCVQRGYHDRHLTPAIWLTPAEIAQTMTQALHMNTYGGNPLSCSAASAVLDVSV